MVNSRWIALPCAGDALHNAQTYQNENANPNPLIGNVEQMGTNREPDNQNDKTCQIDAK
jgi:hypothetical protein